VWAPYHPAVVYRDRFHSCLSCGTEMKDAYAAGHRFEKCPECGALWVEEGQLACMYNDLAGPFARPELDGWASSGAALPAETTRRCLSCEKPMRQLVLHQVTVHRCADHGIWFDRNELQMVLERVALAVRR